MTSKLLEPALGDQSAACEPAHVPMSVSDSPGEPVSASDALDQLVDEARKVVGGSGAGLLVSTGLGTMKVALVSGSFPAPIGDLATPTADAITWGDGTSSPLLGGDREAAASPGAAAPPAVGVPIRLDGILVGELVVVAPPGGKAVPPAKLALLDEIAARASHGAARERISSLEGQLAEWSAIVEVGQVLTGLLDMEDVLSYVVYLAESLVGGHSAAVALRVEGEDAFILKNSSGSLRAIEGEKLPTAGSVVGSVIQNGEPTLSACLSDDPRGYRLGGRQGPGVVVPITNSGQVIGAFVVARIEGSPRFGTDSMLILQKMAAYAAIAITNAEIHRKQQATADALRQQATELEEAYGTLRLSQEQLLTSEKMAALGRITAGIAHEINSPLGGVLNALRAARGFVGEYQASAADPDITADDHRAIAGDIINSISTAESAASKVALFVKSIKGQTRAGEGDVSVFDPAAEVDSTVVLLQHDLKNRRVAVFTEMERGLRLTGDQTKFGMVIQNLISNAVDAYDGKPGEIWIRLSVKDNRIRLSVEDQGSGIPEEVRGKIFDYLFTTKDVGKGTGLGLSMVHSVITTTFQGELELDTEVGRGTTFTVLIPLTPNGTDHGA